MVTEPIFKMEVSEAAFQTQVEQLATLYGWDWIHIRRAQYQPGIYRTPVTGTLGAGWPDLFLTRGSRTICAELKAEKGSLSAKQVRVLNALEAAGHEVFCWKPSDWNALNEVLR